MMIQWFWQIEEINGQSLVKRNKAFYTDTNKDREKEGKTKSALGFEL